MKLDRSTIDRFLEPRLLRALARLPLMSRRVVEGAMVGSHRSPFKGFSTEFADHRSYVRGDDLRHLDWKVLARSERFYIKRYEENTNLRGYILLDCSASMRFPDKPAQGRMTKYEYACRLAAGLAYVLVKQQDPVGMFLFNDKIVAEAPAMRSLSHLRKMLRLMDETPPESNTSSGRAFNAVAHRLKRRGLLLIISDLMDDPEPIVQSLAHFRQRGHDAIVIQVLDDSEIHFPHQETVTLRDMESGQLVTVDGAEVAADYTRRLGEFLDHYKRSCFEHNFDYVLANTATPYDALLTALLSRRKR